MKINQSRILIIILIFFCLSCKQKAESNVPDNENSLESITVKKVSTMGADSTINTLNPSETEKVLDKKTVNESIGRYLEFPSDNNFNGKPMTQQLEIKQSVLKTSPDTLKQIAMERYSSYSSFFPVSISDNFEEGISTEHIHYTKLTFRFLIFENEYSLKPYVEEFVTIKRESNGELVVE
jgi:hypothetical protein